MKNDFGETIEDKKRFILQAKKNIAVLEMWIAEAEIAIIEQLAKSDD